jgi:hypothetical protein
VVALKTPATAGGFDVSCNALYIVVNGPVCYDWRVQTLFAHVYPDELRISLPRIQLLVDSYTERKRTGVIRLGYASKKHLYLLFKRGELLNSYLVSPPGRLESFQPGEWVSRAETAGDAHTRVVTLSGYGLFVAKLLISSTGGKLEEFSTPAQLSGYIASLEKRAETFLFQVNWDRAMGGMLFSSPMDNEAHSIFLSQETASEENGAHGRFFTWNEMNCVTETGVPDLSVDAWREFYLRKSFSEICRLMLGRFELMTGRALVDSLVRLVSVCASRNNLDIAISSRKVVDNEVFFSPEEAAQGYRKILKEMFSHFSSVVGSRLLSLTLQDILASLSDLERSVISASSLLPEGYIHETKNA